MVIYILTVCAALAGFFAGAGVCVLVLQRCGGKTERKAARDISHRDEELLKAVESYGRK